MTSDDYYAPTHLAAARRAWHEFKEAVGFEAFCLYDPSDLSGKRPLPVWLARCLAPWKPLAWQFSRYKLEQLFRPARAARREDLSNIEQAVFWGGGASMSDEEWAYADALVAEFGSKHMPPRDWQPAILVEEIGLNMGMTREEVRAITAKPATA